MAGSYRHITDENNNFRGFDTIDNMGDAFEACEECYYLIGILSGWDKEKIRNAYIEFVRLKGGDVDYATKRNYWHE